MESRQKPRRKLTRREVLKHGFYGSLAATLPSSIWLGGCGRGRREKRPNVIFIVIDTLRADHVGCYGYQRNTTPNIDKLAREGILFKNAISVAPWTLPSIGTLLTSQYPSVLGVRDTAPLDEKFPLISQVLKRHNYTTHGVISHILLSQRLGLGRGYDKYMEWASRPLHEGISSPAVTKQAISFLQQKQENPFFLFTHYFDPHYNYLLHEKYNYYSSYRGKITSGQLYTDIARMRHSLSEEDIRYLISLYDSEISFTDEYVGKLLDELKQQRLYDNSVIVLVGDHGEEFMEKGWLGHSINLNHKVLHVPLIIKLPDGEPGIIEKPFGLIDVMPTICQYLGLEVPGGLEGQPFDFHRHASQATRPIFSETFKQQPGFAFQVGVVSILLERRKLIYDFIKKTKQIYDLVDDPDERNNLADQPSEQNRMLGGLLSKWIENIETKRRDVQPAQSDELFTPDQRKQLESLGYL